MTGTVITVRGTHRVLRLAEQASVSAAAQHEGPRRETVLAATSATSARLREAIEPLAASGAVAGWSTDRVIVRVDRPWGDGKRLAPVYSATVGLRAVFVDVDALGRWIEDVAPLDGVEISGPTWELTDATRDALLDEARIGAIRDAVRRAGVSATAAGLGPVVVTAIADPGLLAADPGASGGAGSAPGGMPKLMMARSDAGGAGFSLTPEELEVSAEVEARFTAS
jgi:uncharacterized protein YggE